MKDEDLEKILIASLTRVNEWLRFAETKNAALLTFSSAWLLAICSLWSNDKCPAEIRWPMLVACPFVIFAAFTALISLVPKMQRKAQGVASQPLAMKNLLFHGNIGKLDIATAATKFIDHYSIEKSNNVLSNHIVDLSTQLVETSKIATWKFKLFSVGVCFIIGAMTSALILLLLIFFFG